ncbi:MAG TPA: PilW family protein [Burkholderiaceae bacterium]|nr:PilW family protein [Burkholderiaceae bacterium]
MRQRSSHLRRPRWRARGLTLIEVMVSITISLVILGALVYIYVGSRGAYRSNEALARAQETGRFAIDWLTRDLRMIGHMGCGSRFLNAINVIARPPVPVTGIDDAMRGYVDDTSGWTAPTGVTYVRGDVLVTRRAVGSDVAISQATDKDAYKVTLAHSCTRFKKDDLVMLATCDRAVVFRVTNEPTYPATNCAGTPLELYHVVGSGTKGNGTIGEPDSAKFDMFQTNTRAAAQRFDEVTYFIGNNPGGRPALYRHSALADAAEEVVDNVENLEFLYGLDTNNDGAPDAYRNAAALAAADWAHVHSVRVSVVVIGGETGAATGAQTYAFRGATQTAGDSRLRRVFTTTVALRNRLD